MINHNNIKQSLVICGFLLCAFILPMLSGCGGGSPKSHDLSGYVTTYGLPLAGATVTLSGATWRTTTTDANGYYIFNGVDDGTYAISPPLLAGHNFSPASIGIIMRGANGTNLNFVGTSVGILSTTLHTVYMNNAFTVSTWGNNNHGQLGDGTTAQRSTAALVSGMVNILSIAAGDEHTVALKSDSTVWAWGNNTKGQLGDGTNIDEWTPVQVINRSTLTPLGGVIAVAAGNAHTVALMVDSTVWTWGSNSKGQLGDATNIDELMPVQVQVATGSSLAPLTGVIAVAAGFEYSVALKSDGTVWAWGSNFSGQLGDGTNIDEWTAIQVPGLTGITAIAAGHDHSPGLGNDAHTMALKNDGTVWAWGANDSGQLGDGTTTDRWSPVQVSGLTAATVIASGDDHSVALKSDGTVWTWGNNSKGQLGDGTTTPRVIPAQVSGLANIMHVAAGYKNTVVRRKDGAIWAWGNNSNGQLGDGTTTDRWTPVQVQ